MPSLDDLELVGIVQQWPRITTASGSFRKRREHVERCERARRYLDAFGFGGDLPADVREKFCLQLYDAFFSAEHFLFPVAQLGRGEALRIRERLASFVFDRNACRIRF